MSDLKVIENLFDKYSDFVCTSDDGGERLVDMDGFKKAIMEFSENKELHSGQTKESTMYKVTFQSDNTEALVLDLPFIPQKGNVFYFVSPLIPINHNHGNDDYFLKVKSVGISIDKDGKICNIEAWCKCY